MHIYEKDYRELYDRQPKELSHLEKILRIDKLSCIEMDIGLSINPNINTDWFFILSIILTEEYLQRCPDLMEFEYLEEIVREQAKQQTGLSTQAGKQEGKKAVIVYVKMRKQLIEHVQESYSVRPR